jgi:hypothetical protein
MRSALPIIPENWDPTAQKGLKVYTYSYFPYDQVRSALQKAIRRSQVEEASQWFAEGFLTNSECRTNIWNGLLTIALEDIGLAHISAIYNIIQLAKDKDNLLAGITGAQYLAKCEKTRLNDWALHLYPEFNDCKYVENLEPPEVLKQKLILAITTKNTYHSLWYLKALFYTPVKVTGKYKNAQILIWESFLELKLGNKYILELYGLSMSPNWRWSERGRLIHVHILHLLIYDVVPKINLKLEITDIDTSAYYAHQNLVGIPDYAIDKHTKAGRELNRGISHFMKEGAILVGECEKYKAQSEQYLSLCKF